MIQSMTGYGKATAELSDKKINVEIKSLNSKAMDLSTRIAPLYREKEIEIRNEIAKALERGKVDFSLWIDKKDACELVTPINQDVVVAYYERIRTISETTGIPAPEDWFSTLLRMPDVMTKNDIQELSEEEWKAVHATVLQAIQNLVEFRIQEGAALEKKFREKISNIAKLLNEQSFSFTALEFLNIHRHLFEGVFKHAGKLRSYDISKKEWVLRGDSVVYGRAADIMMALRYDIQQEKDFNYNGLNTDEIIDHIVDFVTLLWQNHPFREGNTRTTAVFVIKYLRSIGFKVDNDLFADNSWYFRNALVRANYRNPSKGIEPNKSFLIKFFRNLLMGEDHELKNRYMLVGYNDVDATSASTHTSTHTSTYENTHTSSDSSVSILSENIKRLLVTIGTGEKSVKEMMEAVGLKNRPNFLEYSLSPAITEGLVKMKYPNSPRHPRQKYLLTVKGLMVYDDCLKSKRKI